MPSDNTPKLSLPDPWQWATDERWNDVVRCARRPGRQGPVDVYLTEDDGLVVLEGTDHAPREVILAVCGVEIKA